MWDQAYTNIFTADAGCTKWGRTVLITGGTSGIGREAARILAEKGAQVILVGRDPARVASTVAWARKRAGHERIDGLVAELSSQAEIRRLAREVQEKFPAVDVLVNNAGSMFSKREMTVDGFERTWALNHLAYFLLTMELLDLLKANTPSRIVNVASHMHEGGVLNFNDLQGERGYSCIPAYRQSKLANVLFTKALARRLVGTRVTANALHPGAVATGMGRDMTGLLRLANRFCQLFFLSPARGAATPVYLASSPEVEGVSGKYFTKCRETKAAAITDDVDLQERLWRVSAEHCGLRELV